MLSGGKQKTKNKSKFVMLGVFISLTAIILASCAHNSKKADDAKNNKGSFEQVRAYSLIPAAKPTFARARKIIAEKTARLTMKSLKTTSKSAKTLAYLSPSERAYKKVGRASWYGEAFNGRLTANGEVYDMHNLTAAHPTMPLPSYARVTNLENGSSLIVRVNDRGPFIAGRIIDLSKQAATMLDYKDDGLADVKIEYIGRAPLEGNDREFLMASYKPKYITVDTLLAMAGMNLSYSYDNHLGTSSNFTKNKAISNQMKPRESVPELPDVGPTPAFKPETSQLLAFADEATQTSKQRVFDSVLRADATKAGRDEISHPNSRYFDGEEKTADIEPATTTDYAISQTKSAERALQLAWAAGVSQAFSIGSAQ